MIREAIEKLIRGADLTQEEAARVMEEIMTGEGHSGPIRGIRHRAEAEGRDGG